MKRYRKRATYRAPVYDKDSNLLRVVSVHGDRWVGQRKIGDGDAKHDPWVDLAAPCKDKVDAMAQMKYKAQVTG